MKNFKKAHVLIAGAVLLLLIISLILVLRKETPQPTANVTSNTSSGGSTIRLENNTTPTPQQTLAQLKASPKYQNPRKDIAYADLARNADQYKGEIVNYDGKVIQVLGEPGNWNLRVNITRKPVGSTDFWDDTMFIFSYSNERVIEKDIINFTAVVNGTYTYEAVFGQSISLPSLVIYEHKLIGRSDY